MKISAIELLCEKDGLLPFRLPMLGDLVLVTGCNGAGKTRLLKMIHGYINSQYNGKDTGDIIIEITEDEKSEKLTKDNVKKVRIINYSHYDAILQSPRSFSPYVIHKAKEILKKCDYEETALNSLLFIEDMAKGYSKEFEDGKRFEAFKKDVEENFNIMISYDKDQLQLFGLNIEKAALSPGQQYLLRMAVACFQNEDESGLIFFMDEPELHLHPKALIQMIEKLRKKFPDSQFWISTHSLSLISYYTIMKDNVTTLYLENKKVDLFRSNSSGLLDGLIGDEENQFAVQQLFGLTDEYACNRFTFECFDKPKTIAGKDGKDIEVDMIKLELSPNDVVVDYGAGKGRFLEELFLGGGIGEGDCKCGIQYYAYDPDGKDSALCKEVMNKYGSTEHNYFNDVEQLKDRIRGTARYVLLVNVLHEIPPNMWGSIFGNIKELLKEDGKLLIVERDELMVGEAPYKHGFLMITSNGCRELFKENNFEEIRHPEKKYIVKYIIKKEGLDVDKSRVKACIQAIQKDSLDNIKKAKNIREEERIKKFKVGMKLVFWLHQYANSSLIINEDNW